MERLERLLAQLSLFDCLRPDEMPRVAQRFEVRALRAGEALLVGGDATVARLAVLLSGRATLALGPEGDPTLRVPLVVGDRYGELPLLTGLTRRAEILAREDTELALLDRAGLDALLEELPVLGLPLADELSRELAARNDIVRELLEVHAEGMPAEALRECVAERKKALVRRATPVRRVSVRAIYTALVAQRGKEPHFWMLAGFLLSFGLARLVVFLILRYHLERQLFALVPGNDPNPMHVHHFNYGLVLVGLSGLAGLMPLGRRALRVLAFVFGLGCGLIFDEFALFWNLNPEYAQGLSLVAAAVAVTVLVQLVYFRRFWEALLRRAWMSREGGAQ